MFYDVVVGVKQMLSTHLGTKARPCLFIITQVKHTTYKIVNIATRHISVTDVGLFLARHLVHNLHTTYKFACLDIDAYAQIFSHTKQNL